MTYGLKTLFTKLNPMYPKRRTYMDRSLSTPTTFQSYLCSVNGPTGKRPKAGLSPWQRASLILALAIAFVLGALTGILLEREKAREVQVYSF